jgi:hypothetical protein
MRPCEPPSEYFEFVHQVHTSSSYRLHLSLGTSLRTVIALEDPRRISSAACWPTCAFRRESASGQSVVAVEASKELCISALNPLNRSEVRSSPRTVC